MCKCGCVEKNTITFRLIYSLFLKANHHLVQPSKHKVVTCVSPEVSMLGTCVCMAPEQSTVILLARHRHLQWCWPPGADLAAPGGQHRGRRGGGGGGLLRPAAHPRPPCVGQAAQRGEVSTQSHLIELEITDWLLLQLSHLRIY